MHWSWFATGLFKFCLLHAIILVVACTPLVANVLCHFWLSVVNQCPLFIVLAAGECSIVCMGEMDPCFAHGLGLGFAMSSCFTVACLLLLVHQ